jgi:hypothetical protein
MGVAYVALTPLWQAPDEPAHFNYVRYLAEHAAFPVLQMGDYPHDYLEQIKAAKFPPSMSVDSIRYEFHQPPLYYAIAALVYKAASGLPLAQQVFALRLLSLLFGAMLLVVAYAIVSEIFPSDTVLALGATAFVATVPMHVAMTAAINNDALAELLLAALLLVPVLRIKGTLSPRNFALWGGLLLGLGLLTKTTVYPAALILLAAEWGRWRLERTNIRSALLPLAALFALSFLLSFWWFIRNALTYDGLDFFGWARHDAIVIGQPQTREWLAQLGVFGLLKAFLVTTFHSFWAQFGWMGVLIDSRLYFVLAVLCAVAAAGLVFLAMRLRRERFLSAEQLWSLGLLLLALALTAASYLWYNLKFVQHQGRYLFPAIVPIGVFFTMGLREAIRPEQRRLVAALFVAALVLAGVGGVLRGGLSKLELGVLAGGAITFGALNLSQRDFDVVVIAATYAAMWLLDAVCLLGFIVPALR